MPDSKVKNSTFYTRIAPVIKHPMVQSYAPIVFNLVFITIFIVFAIRPTISTVSNLQKTIEENQKTLDVLDAKAKALSLGKKNLESIPSDKREKIDNALPLGPSVPKLIYDLQNSFTGQASISGLQVQPLNLFNSQVTQRDLTTPGEINFSFNLQGEYASILTILTNLQNSPRALNLQAITISKQAQNQSSILNLSINGKAYYIK